MYRSKAVIAAALLVVPALLAVTSIMLDPVTERDQVSVAAADQVNTFHLMAIARRLPAQSYDAY